MLATMIPSDLGSLLYRQIRAAEERNDRVYEAVIGIVVNNTDEAKLGRVKVKFPTLPGADESHWAPVCSFGAGNERGWFFLPEVDDEVLVMFEHGDIRRPVIIGAMWNGVDKPPDKNDGADERRRFTSRAGSVVILDDAEKTITIRDGKGKGEIVIKDKNITFESAGGDVCIQAPSGELNVVAKEIVADAKANFHLQSGSGINLSAGATVEAKAPSLQVIGASVGLNPGGVAKANKASAKTESVADPVKG